MRSRIIGTLALSLAPLLAPAALAFTQSVPGISCPGHEEITAHSARLLLDECKKPANAAKKACKSESVSLLKDPWWGAPPAVRANCSVLPGMHCSDYGASSYAVYSSIIGQRWVDLMGFAAIPATLSALCNDAVAQNHDDVQYDHALRKRCDVGTDGRNRAVLGTKLSVRRAFLLGLVYLKKFPSLTIKVSDGGEVQRTTTVNAAFFHFGRAAHTFQDSFSPEHTRRGAGAKKNVILDVKTHVCTPGVPMHAHAPRPAPGDIVRHHGCDVRKTWWHGVLGPMGAIPTAIETYQAFKEKASPSAALATAAMKDLWGAFLSKDTAEMDRVLDRWFAFDPRTPPPAAPPSASATAKCLEHVDDNPRLEAQRRFCLSKTGTSGENPRQPPYNWSENRLRYLACGANNFAMCRSLELRQPAKAPYRCSAAR